jgi:hypothetical protein
VFRVICRWNSVFQLLILKMIRDSANDNFCTWSWIKLGMGPRSRKSLPLSFKIRRRFAFLCDTQQRAESQTPNFCTFNLLFPATCLGHQFYHSQTNKNANTHKKKFCIRTETYSVVFPFSWYFIFMLFL